MSIICLNACVEHYKMLGLLINNTNSVCHPRMCSILYLCAWYRYIYLMLFANIYYSNGLCVIKLNVQHIQRKPSTLNHSLHANLFLDYIRIYPRCCVESTCVYVCVCVPRVSYMILDGSQFHSVKWLLYFKWNSNGTRCNDNYLI